MLSVLQTENVDFDYFSVSRIAQCPAAKALVAEYAANRLTPDAQDIGLDVLGSFLAYLNCPGGKFAQGLVNGFFRMREEVGLLVQAKSNVALVSDHMTLPVESIVRYFALDNMHTIFLLLNKTVIVADGEMPSLGPLPVPTGDFQSQVSFSPACLPLSFPALADTGRPFLKLSWINLMCWHAFARTLDRL